MENPSESSIVASLFHPLGVGFVLLLLVIVPYSVRSLDPGDYSPELGYSSEAQTVRNTSAVSRLFGELRTSMSDVMFIKTERYLHNGVAYQPHITIKDFSEPDSATTEYASIPTTIRPPDQDWRGFIGNLEREIKPWRDPAHHMAHEKGVELLPWFRLMTLVNPHRIRGYKIGAFLMMTRDSPDSLQQAVDFIQEGLKHNPDSHELYYMLIRLIQMDVRLSRSHHIELTPETLRKKDEDALYCAKKGIEVAAPRRPPGGWKGKGRPAELEDSFAACLHYQVLLLRRLGRDEEALRSALDLLERFGNDPVLQNEVAELRAKLQTSG